MDERKLNEETEEKKDINKVKLDKFKATVNKVKSIKKVLEFAKSDLNNFEQLKKYYNSKEILEEFNLSEEELEKLLELSNEDLFMFIRGKYELPEHLKNMLNIMKQLTNEDTLEKLSVKKGLKDGIREAAKCDRCYNSINKDEDLEKIFRILDEIKNEKEEPKIESEKINKEEKSEKGESSFKPAPKTFGSAIKKENNETYFKTATSFNNKTKVTEEKGKSAFKPAPKSFGEKKDTEIER